MWPAEAFYLSRKAPNSAFFQKNILLVYENMLILAFEKIFGPPLDLGCATLVYTNR
jgi:hypothetical protein